MTFLPTDDDVLSKRLSKLGEYSYQDEEFPEFRWKNPSTAPASFRSFEIQLLFDIEPDVDSCAAALDEFDRISQIADVLLDDAKRCAVELFGEIYAGQMSDEELVPYRDKDGNVADALVLNAVGPSAIVLTATNEGICADICFDCDWDDEHGLEFPVHGESIPRPWRPAG